LETTVSYYSLATGVQLYRIVVIGFVEFFNFSIEAFAGRTKIRDQPRAPAICPPLVYRCWFDYVRVKGNLNNENGGF